MQQRVLTSAEFREITRRWQPGVGFDLETNGKELWEPGARIVGASFAGWTNAAKTEAEGFYTPLAHKKGNADPSILGTIIEFLRSAHVAPYYIPMEAAWVWKKWNTRLIVSGDAYVAARILHLKEGGLKDCVEAYLKKSVIRIEQCLPDGCYDFSEADSDDVTTITYCAEDAINALTLERVFHDRITEHHLDAVYMVELQATTQMAMESADGYAFDTAAFQAEVRKEKTRLTRLEQEVFTGLGGKAFLISSTTQLGKRLGELGIESPLKTPNGSPSWSKAALELVADKHPVIPKIIEWKSSFAVTNMLGGKAATAVDGDGRVHPRWNPMSFRGGARFACEKPPLPTLPTQMRRAFTAPEGKRWVMLQWRQPEWRMLAVLARCLDFATFVTTSKDVHADWAKLWGCSREEAKTAAYHYLHSGMNLDAVALYVKDATVIAAMSGWFEAYPEIKAYVQETAKAGAEKYHVRSWLNRRYKCEEETPELRGLEAIQAAVSGSVATALKVALCKITMMRDTFRDPNTLTGYSLKGLGQIIPAYDTLYYTLDDDAPLYPHFGNMVRAFQINLLEAESGEFPLPCDVGVGWNWGAIQKVEHPEDVQAFADELPR